MSLEKVTSFLRERGAEDKIRIFDVSSATVALAAKALGTEEARIAKSMAFLVENKPVIVVTAGDMKIDNAKFRSFFHSKAKMLTPEELVGLVGHAPGGVCPFALNDGCAVYLDESLKRFDTVYPAAGSSNSAVELTVGELEALSGALGWVSVCKPKSEQK